MIELMGLFGWFEKPPEPTFLEKVGSALNWIVTVAIPGIFNAIIWVVTVAIPFIFLVFIRIFTDALPFFFNKMLPGLINGFYKLSPGAQVFVCTLSFLLIFIIFLDCLNSGPKCPHCGGSLKSHGRDDDDDDDDDDDRRRREEEESHRHHRDDDK